MSDTVFYAFTTKTVAYDYNNEKEVIIDSEYKVFTGRHKIMQMIRWFDNSEFTRVNVVAVGYKNVGSLRGTLASMIDRNIEYMENHIEVCTKHDECFLVKIRKLEDYEKHI